MSPGAAGTPARWRVLDRRLERPQAQPDLVRGRCVLRQQGDLGKQPRVLTLKRAITHFIEHRQEVIRRRTTFELEKAKQRAHILEGLRIALDHIDAIIATIRNSRTTESASRSTVDSLRTSTETAVGAGSTSDISPRISPDSSVAIVSPLRVFTTSWPSSTT